ncbi:MAG TPA: hypothetical protein V6C97_21770, partial [Oculatellaceae cyanobacterium]
EEKSVLQESRRLSSPHLDRSGNGTSRSLPKLVNKPQTFCGTEDLEAWLDEYLIQTDIAGWTEAEKKVGCYSFLRGEALEEVKYERQDTSVTFNHIVNKLRRRFSHRNPVDYWQSAIENVNMDGNDDTALKKFTTSFRRAVYNLREAEKRQDRQDWKGVDPVPETHLCKRFIDGLSEPLRHTVRQERLRRKERMSLTGLYDMSAELMETLIPPSKPTSNNNSGLPVAVPKPLAGIVAVTVETQQPTTTYQTPTYEEQPYARQNNDDLVRTMDNLNRGLDEFTRKMSTSTSSNSQPGRGQSRQRPPRTSRPRDFVEIPRCGAQGTPCHIEQRR